MTKPRTPDDVAALLLDAVHALERFTVAQSGEDPLLIGPARLGKLLDISTRTAAFRMRAGMYGPVIVIGKEARVRMRGVELWIAEHEGKEEPRNVPSAPENDRAVGERGKRAGEHLRKDRPDPPVRGRPGSGARVIAIAPRSARTASR